MLITFNRNSRSFGESDDRVVTVASQMRTEAQQEARRIYGFDLTHTGVLQDHAVAKLLNEILAGAAR
jgi:hypothetical protein